MVSVTQAANALGISRAAVHKAIQQRRLPAQRFGNVVLVDREAVARYKRGRGEAEGRSGAVESRRTERAALTAPGRDSRPSARSFHGSAPVCQASSTSSLGDGGPSL
jgi:excisionase family DNA binding protein